MLYIVRRPLGSGEKAGDLVRGDKFKNLEALVGVNAVEEIGSIQLSTIPGWVLRSETLNHWDIYTIQDYWETDIENIAKIFGRDVENIRSWKDCILNWLCRDSKRDN